MKTEIPSSVDVGRRIRDVRRRAGLTGRALAAAVGQPDDSSLVPEWEQGKRRASELGTIIAVAQACAGLGELVDFTVRDVIDYLTFQADWDLRPRVTRHDQHLRENNNSRRFTEFTPLPYLPSLNHLVLSRN